MTNQYVTITVTEGEKTLTVTHEKLYEWPGQTVPHISKLIGEVATEAARLIDEAEPGDDLSEPF
jgi:hypothetical protein